MTDYNNLQKALINVMEERVRDAKTMSQTDSHVFSREFEKKMDLLIDNQKTGKYETIYQNKQEYKPTQVNLFGHMMRRSVVALLVAILIIAMTATAMAIVKPEIFFKIKNKLINWEVTYMQDNDDSESDEFVPIKPITPQGYSISDERLSYADDIIVDYEVIYEDREKHRIIYSQVAVDENVSNKLNIDAEGEDIHRENVNGNEIIVSRHGENETSVIIENDNYVFELYGECPYDHVDKMMKCIIDNQ